MKIQPINCEAATWADHPKPAAKSRLKRLFERRQPPSALRISSPEKSAGDHEPSSIALDGMVRSFMEDGGRGGEKPPRCSRSRCSNCFHGSSDDDPDLAGDPPIGSSADSSDVLKSLILCSSLAERNLLADASKIVEKAKISKGKEETRRMVAVGLRSLGYDASICKSRWEKSPSCPAGEYEYVDVIADCEERLVVEVDLRSEFEIARSTKGYRAVLQFLPSVFVGREDRIRRIVAVVAEAARESLEKKGLHCPPWRRPEYMEAKWLGPYEREIGGGGGGGGSILAVNLGSGGADGRVVATWQPPAVRPKEGRRGGRVVTGLASVFREKN